MSGAALQPADPQKPAKVRPFRRAVLRGLGVVMPPLLTLVLFIWAWATIDSYVLKPIETGIGQTIVFFSVRANVKSSIPIDANVEDVMVVDRSNERIPPDKVLLAAGRVEGIERTARAYAWRVVSFRFEGTQFVPTSDHKWVPDDVFDEVKGSPGKLSLSNATANEIYERYVQLRYFPRWQHDSDIFGCICVGLVFAGALSGGGSGPHLCDGRRGTDQSVAGGPQRLFVGQTGNRFCLQRAGH